MSPSTSPYGGRICGAAVRCISSAELGANSDDGEDEGISSSKPISQKPLLVFEIALQRVPILGGEKSQKGPQGSGGKGSQIVQVENEVFEAALRASP